MCPHRLSRSIRCCASAVLLLGMMSGSVRAQSSTYLPLRGRVELETEDGKPIPVGGAHIDVYGLDSGGHWSAVSDQSGFYSILNLPYLGKYLIIASGPGMRFLWANKVELRNLHNLDFLAMPGEGKRPTLEEVQSRIARGESRLAQYPSLNKDQTLVVKSVYTKAEREHAFAERYEFELSSAEAIGLQRDLNRATEVYNKAIQDKLAGSYESAIAGFQHAALFDPARHPAFAELAYRTTANIAEIHYLMGIDLLNFGQLYGAKPNFENASAEMTRAIALASENPGKDPRLATELITYYRILAKNDLLVIKHYGEKERVDEALKAIAEARRIDQTPKPAWDLLEADIYKAAARSSDAARAYRNALTIDPDSLDALYNLSLLLIVSGEKGDLLEAIKYMSRFVEKAPPSDPRYSEVRATLESLKKQVLDDSEKREGSTAVKLSSLACAGGPLRLALAAALRGVPAQRGRGRGHGPTAPVAYGDPRLSSPRPARLTRLLTDVI